MRVLSVLLAVALSLVPSGLAQTASVSIGYLPATHDTLLFIAVEQHYLQDEGLIPQLFQFHNSPEILQALLAQRVDIGIPGVAAPVMFISSGAHLHIIGGAAMNSAAVVVPQSYAAKFAGKGARNKLALFQGMRIGTVKQSTGDAIFRHSLKESGIASSIDIREFATPGQVLTALRSGSLDAAVLWSPYMSIAETQGMSIVLWISELMPGNSHVCCRQVVQDQYLRAHRPELVKYMKALIRAMLFYENPANRSRVLEIDAKYIQGISPNILQEELYANPPRTTLSVDIAPGGIVQYVDAMQDTGQLTPQQVTTTLDGVDETIIRDAYLSLGLKASEADECVKKGLLMCPITRRHR